MINFFVKRKELEKVKEELQKENEMLRKKVNSLQESFENLKYYNENCWKKIIEKNYEQINECNKKIFDFERRHSDRILKDRLEAIEFRKKLMVEVFKLDRK